MAEIGSSEPADLKRFERKFKAIERAKRRLAHRLSDIDWELDELQPAYEAQIERSLSLGQLPSITLLEEGVPDDGSEDDLPPAPSA